MGPLSQDGHLVRDNKSMADILNSYFGSVFTNNTPNTSQFALNQRIFGEPVTHINITPNDSVKKIKNLKPNSAAGPDNISARFLQTFSYRPVSLTSIVCKIMEKLLKEKIVKHLSTYNLINPSQHGFTKHKSCSTNLLEFFEFVTYQVDRGNPVDVVYLDFAKTFDKVPKLRLLEKIKSMSITGNILGWIGNWLTDRRQRVKVGNSLSEWLPVESGVPQGSVFGPD